MSDLRREGWAVSVWVNTAGQVHIFHDRWVRIEVASRMVDISERGGGRHQLTAPLGATLIQWELEGDPAGAATPPAAPAPAEIPRSPAPAE